MSQQLWLLRHGEAVPKDAKPDFDRELTARGEHQSVMAGRALARLGLDFAACFTSPRVRALETARLACRPLGVEPVEHRELGKGDFEAKDALELLAGYDGDARVLVVGHEPDFSQIVFDLTGGRVDFKKGGVAGMRIARGSGELLVLLRPRDLDSLAGEEPSGEE